jgi:hypothetical protein
MNEEEIKAVENGARIWNNTNSNRLVKCIIRTRQLLKDGSLERIITKERFEHAQEDFDFIYSYMKVLKK